MMHKRKKNTRQHGSKSWGWGSMKKNRGKGNKGGAGNAGSGKRGDAKKPTNWDKKYFGKHGFKSIGMRYSTISIASIEQKYKDNDNEVKLNLTELGFEKLLGQGKPTCKYLITVAKSSKKAIEKVKNAGGSVTVTEAAEN